MTFFHDDEPIKDVVKYKEMLSEMKNCYSDTFGTEYILKSWKDNDKINQDVEGYRNRYEACFNYTVDDCELILDCKKPKVARLTDRHYYIMFPILSYFSARRMNSPVRDWLHVWLMKLIMEFPYSFELYYGDGPSGFIDDGEMEFYYGSYGVFRGNRDPQPDDLSEWAKQNAARIHKYKHHN